MLHIENAILSHVLRRVVARACPSTVHRSGKEGEEVNCFNTTVVTNGQPELVLLEIVENDVKGLRYDGSRYSIEVSIPLSDIDPATLHITHFYGLDRIDYEGVWSAARGLWTGWPYAWLHFLRLWNSTAQKFFNRRSLPARRRLDLLREVIEASSRGTSQVDALDLMTSRHGNRWAGHPSWQSHHEQLESQLELLADAGDLRKADSGYRPTGQGLRTLEETEEADRRHKENFRLQVGLGILAIASALMAAAQAGVVKFPVLLDLASTGKAETGASAPPPCVCCNIAPAGCAPGQAVNATSPVAPALPAAASATVKPVRPAAQ